jgi:hypothetical protein
MNRPIPSSSSSGGPHRGVNQQSFNQMGMHMPYMMGMGMGMGGSVGGGGNNPIAWIYSINQMIYSVSYALDMIGMNSQAIQLLFHRLFQLYIDIVKYVKQSKVRKWLQEKSKKSKLFRIFIIVTSMVMTFQIVKLHKFYHTKSRKTISDSLAISLQRN